MSGIRVITNNHLRDVIYAWELTGSERAEFDYLDWEAIEDGRFSPEFVRYKGKLYSLTDTDGIPPLSMRTWDLYLADSFFSGILFRWPRDGNEIDTEHIIVGQYYEKG